MRSLSSSKVLLAAMMIVLALSPAWGHDRRKHDLENHQNGSTVSTVVMEAPDETSADSEHGESSTEDTLGEASTPGEQTESSVESLVSSEDPVMAEDPVVGEVPVVEDPVVAEDPSMGEMPVAGDPPVQMELPPETDAQAASDAALSAAAAVFRPSGGGASPGWITSCAYSHSNNEDPIVFPGRPGAAHLHDYSAATTTGASSTPDSLRAGGSTCETAGDTSAYWLPALFEDGERVLPTATSQNSLFYYRRKGAPDGTPVQPFPDGLKMIIGNANATSPVENPQLGTDIIFKCGPGSTEDLPAPPRQCDSGVMVMSLRFPNCWDGVNLDSADHRSHMAYPTGSRCPASHPVVLPRLESFFRYDVGTGPIGEITLASGPYYTAHQDFFNAWGPSSLQTLVANCINAMVDCGKNPLR